VDLPDPPARAEAAKRIAARPDATLPALLAAARAFGRFAPVKPGVRTEAVRLFDGKTEVLAEVTVYTPPGYDPAAPAPCLLALHGSGGDGREEHLPWKGTADALGMMVVAPSDPGPNQGYEFTEAERTLTLSALRWARRRWNLDENRIFGTGISRGGHLLWDLALRRPDLFAAIVPAIGAPRMSNQRGENNLRYLENLRRLPIRDLQGAKDDPLLLENLRLAFGRLAAWGNGDAKLHEFPDLGHSFELGVEDWAAFLGKARRDPWPEEVLRCAAEPREARAGWAEILAFGKEVKTTFALTVDGKEWAAKSEAERRKAFESAVEARTARLSVRRTGPGAFQATGREVERFRLLLPEGAFEKGPVTVEFRGRTVKASPKPDGAVLLQEFVERFDRTFLPVAEVRVP